MQYSNASFMSSSYFEHDRKILELWISMRWSDAIQSLPWNQDTATNMSFKKQQNWLAPFTWLGKNQHGINTV